MSVPHTTSGDWSEMLFDLAPVIFLVLDEGLDVLRINERGAAALGLKYDDVVGNNWIEHFVPGASRDEQRRVIG
ncbi:MAG: PAS domain-containing protein, partial [Rhodothermales bacterium]